MIRGTREQVLEELYKRYPAKFREHGEVPQYFFATHAGSFEEQLRYIEKNGKVIFFQFNQKLAALSLEQEDIEIIL